MKKFEYNLFFDRRLELEQFNKLGEEGWELVTHTIAVSTGGGFYHYYTFKREKQ